MYVQCGSIQQLGSGTVSALFQLLVQTAVHLQTHVIEDSPGSPVAATTWSCPSTHRCVHMCIHITGPGQKSPGPTSLETRYEHMVLASRDPQTIWFLWQLDWTPLVYAMANSSCVLTLRCPHHYLPPSPATSPTCQFDRLMYRHPFQSLAPQTHGLAIGFTYSSLFSHLHQCPWPLWPVVPAQVLAARPSPVPGAGHHGHRGHYDLRSLSSCWNCT